MTETDRIKSLPLSRRLSQVLDKLGAYDDEENDDKSENRSHED